LFGGIIVVIIGICGNQPDNSSGESKTSRIPPLDQLHDRDVSDDMYEYQDAMPCQLQLVETILEELPLAALCD
jgi:hypothetical protein